MALREAGYYSIPKKGNHGHALVNAIVHIRDSPHNRETTKGAGKPPLVGLLRPIIRKL